MLYLQTMTMVMLENVKRGNFVSFRLVVDLKKLSFSENIT